MKQFSIYILLLSLFFATSCKKDELPESQIGTPEFASEFTFNGEQYTMEVGENGLVQTTAYDTSGAAIELNGFTGAADCGTCGPSFAITVQSPSDFVYTNGQNMVAELNTWDYALNRDSAAVSSVLKMSGMLMGGIYGGDWSLNGSPIESNSDSILLEITDPGNYTVEYAVSQDSCTVSTTRNFDFDGLSLPCYGNIIQDVNSPTTFTAYPAFPFDPVGMTYIWTSIDTVMNTGSGDSYEFTQFALTGEICVEMTNAQGCSATACYTPNSNSDASQFCSAEVFLNGAELIDVVQQEFDANLILEFTDSSGDSFTSETGSQANASFSIISINDYTEPTMPGKKFAKMELSISCTLYDDSGNGYPFSGVLQTAFEYP